MSPYLLLSFTGTSLSLSFYRISNVTYKLTIISLDQACNITCSITNIGMCTSVSGKLYYSGTSTWTITSIGTYPESNTSICLIEHNSANNMWLLNSAKLVTKCLSNLNSAWNDILDWNHLYVIITFIGFCQARIDSCNPCHGWWRCKFYKLGNTLVFIK